MEIKVATFEDNKMLPESLRQLINNAEDMASCRSFTNAKKLLCNSQYSYE